MTLPWPSISLEFHSKSIDIHRRSYAWITHDIMKTPWISIAIHAHPWIYTTMHWYSWLSLDMPGSPWYPWIPKDVIGTQRYQWITHCTLRYPWHPWLLMEWQWLLICENLDVYILRQSLGESVNYSGYTSITMLITMYDHACPVIAIHELPFLYTCIHRYD